MNRVRADETRGRAQRRSPFEILREDWRTYQPRAFASASFHALAIYRLGRALGHAQGAPMFPLRALRVGAEFIARTLYSVELPWQTAVGRRLVIGHLGIVIAPDTVIGDDCLIRQNVTIGAVYAGGRAPRLGRGVEIGAGAVVIGDISIGDEAVIGPNCVVTTDVPAGAMVVAAPVRVILRGTWEAESVGPRHEARVSPQAVLETIREAVDSHGHFDEDSPLLSSGLLDSLNIVVALEALESRFGVAISPEAIDAARFDTPRMMAAYLETRRS